MPLTSYPICLKTTIVFSLYTCYFYVSMLRIVDVKLRHSMLWNCTDEKSFSLMMIKICVDVCAKFSFYFLPSSKFSIQLEVLITHTHIHLCMYNSIYHKIKFHLLNFRRQSSMLDFYYYLSELTMDD